MSSTPRIPHPLVAFLPVVLLAAMLFVTISIFGSDSLGGGSQICLLLTSALCVVIGMGFHGVSWQAFEHAITGNVSSVAQALFVLLIIGTLSATWMISGVVPTLIYYGVQVIHPDFFLMTACVICSLVSIMTGSSWTTVATIGIALMGIGKAQGFSEAWIAGAIISGAYFGDKVSPLSDTTILASSVSGVPLFTHIRYMMYTTIPSLLVAIVLFTLMGITHGSGSSTEEITAFTTAIDHRFHLSPWVLAVPVATGVLIARKVPSLITLSVSSVLACVTALIFQPDLLREIAQGGSLFQGIMMTCYGSTSLPTDNALLTSLIATRGMAGMLDTIWLILCAMCFGGAMTAGGMLTSITSLFLRSVRRRVSLVSSTVASGLFLNVATADQYISIILLSKMFGDIYKGQGYEGRLLSRTVEDSTTVTSVLVPWNTCGMTQATVLNVPTIAYLPYCFFNLLSPLMSIIVAAIGYNIFRLTDTGTDSRSVSGSRG